MSDKKSSLSSSSRRIQKELAEISLEPPTNCSAGTISADGADQCSACTGGTYQDEEGMTECKACVAGSYCPLGAAAELPCPATTYSSATDNAAAADWLHCPAGFACAAGSTVPVECEAGSYSTGNASACTGCPEGTYQSNGGASSCEACLPGHYCLEQSRSPLSCPPGTFTASYGRSNCFECTAGSFQSASGAMSCEVCPPGSYCVAGAAAYYSRTRPWLPRAPRPLPLATLPSRATCETSTSASRHSPAAPQAVMARL